MADIDITTKVDAGETTKSIGELKKELKALVSQQQNVTEGSKEWNKLRESINKTENKIDDLNRSFSTLRGTGVERVNASLAQFKDGLTSADPGKLKIAMQGLGSAMKAIPIFLLIEGFRLLSENFSKIIDFGKTLFNVMSDNERAVKKLSAELENEKKITADLNGEIDREIKLMTAMGASSDEIIIKKKELIRQQIKEAETAVQLQLLKLEEIKNNDTIGDQLTGLVAKYYELTGVTHMSAKLNDKVANDKKERVKEEENNLNGLLETIKNLQNDEQVLDEENKRKKLEEEKKKTEELKKLWKAGAEAKKKLDEDLFNAAMDQGEKEMAQAQKFDDIDRKKAEKKILEEEKAAKKKLDELNKQYAEEQKIKKYWQDLADAENDKIAKEVEAQKKLELDRKWQMESNYMNALSGLSDAFFNMQLQAAEGNEDAMNAIRKKQFNADKALKAIQATIDGIKAVNATLAQGGAFALPLAASIGVMAFANVAKILSAQFNPAGGGGASRPSVSTPRVNTTGGAAPQQERLPGQEGTFIQKEQKIYVSAKEINDVQRQNARVAEQSVF
jgi:hypothetical protein